MLHRSFPVYMAVVALSMSLTATACSSDEVNSDEQARRAYLGVDRSVAKSLTLGFAGFSAASNANIPTQMTVGDAGGTLTISGQVDAGTSQNKQMRLHVGMVAYTDGPVVVDDRNNTTSLTYDTDADVTTQPYLQLSLHNYPVGTFTGTLTGVYHLSGDLKGGVTVDLMMSGELQDDGTGKTVRKPGTTTITGTAISGNGTFAVSVTI